MSTREFLPRDLHGVAPDRPPVEVVPLPRAAESVDAATEPMTPGLSLRSNFAWILTGNVVYAACQWGAIVALAKLGSSFMIGQFSLGLAIAAPVLMFTNLHLRAVQATDARRLCSFGEYLRLRAAMTLGGLAVIGGIAWFGHYERQTAMVILAVALAKGIETLSDIHYGLFQLNDRLDQIGRSMMLRGVAFGGGAQYRTLPDTQRSVGLRRAGAGLAGRPALLRCSPRTPLLARSVKVAQPTDRPGQRLRRQWNLMCTALPLGISTTMAALNLNMPRYFIHARLGERQLGIYSAMAYATVAMILVADSLGHCAIPRLSRLYSGGRLAEFRSLLLRLLAAGGSLGFAGLAVARAHGRAAAHSDLWPGVCRSLPGFPGADPGHGNSLCGLYVYQRSHIRAMFQDSSSVVCAGRGFERDWPAHDGCPPPGWPAAPRPWRSRQWCTWCWAPPS